MTMEASLTRVNRLLDLVKRPQQAKRKPSNFALYWAWLFYNGVALLFDVTAAITVYNIMGKLVYAILTFTAGFLPLLMHEFLYTRAYANGWQKAIAVLGACLSVVTIVVVGVLAAIVNVTGVSGVSMKWIEIGMIVGLVLVASGHGLLAAVYFYIDDGIKANQVRAESIAYHERMVEDVKRAREILTLAEAGMREQDEIATQFGGHDVLNEILSQLRGSNLLERVEQGRTPGQAASASNQPAILKAEKGEGAEAQPVPLSLSRPAETPSLSGNGYNGAK